MEIGRKLLRKDERLSAVIIGFNLREASEEAAKYVSKVYVTDDPLLKNFNPELFTYIMEKICAYVNPIRILMSHTYCGADIAPRLSAKLKAPLITDCIGLELDPETNLLKGKKQVYGGSVIATYMCEGRPQLVTMRPKISDKIKQTLDGKGEIVKLNFEIDKSISKTEFIERIREETVKLDDADVIISGGRGLGGPEGFEELKKLKSVLEKIFRKVEIGCSRPPVTLGWLPPSREIGLSAEKVSPRLYIAVGISGAIQHVVGIGGSKVIVSVNTNPDEPIFSVSNYGVVGDYRKVLPAFRKKLEELLCIS